MSLNSDTKTNKTRKKCSFCSKLNPPGSSECRHCGDSLARSVSDQAVANASISDTEIKTVSKTSSVLLIVFTLGLYHAIWLYRTFKTLYARGATETTPGKALGYCFIPIFNIAWIFMVWAEFGNAIKNAYEQNDCAQPQTNIIRLLYAAFPIALAANIFFFPVGSVIGLISLCIVITQAQSWLNRLAAQHIPQRAVGQETDATAHCPCCNHNLNAGDAFCGGCGNELTEAELADVQKIEKRQAALADGEFVCEALRGGSRSKRRIGRICVGVATFFLVANGLQLLSVLSGQTQDSNPLAVLVASVLTVGLPGFFGFMNLKQADALRQECLRKFKMIARQRRVDLAKAKEDAEEPQTSAC